MVKGWKTHLNKEDMDGKRTQMRGRKKIGLETTLFQLMMARNSKKTEFALKPERLKTLPVDASQFLAEFHLFGPEIVVFSILGKFHFSHNSCFPCPNQLPSIPACSGFIAILISIFISNFPFLVILLISVVSLSSMGRARISSLNMVISLWPNYILNY